MATTASRSRTQAWRSCLTSVDFVSALNVAATVVVVAILLLGIVRSLEMRRAFVKPIYKSRASWYAILMGVIIVSNVANFVPNNFTGVLGYIVGTITFIPFIALLAVIYAFVDRTVLVAIESDFFHRNTLGWRSFRWPGFIALVVALGGVFYGSTFLPPTGNTLPPGVPLYAVISFNLFFVVPVVLGYCTVALIVAARRASDRLLKRSILLLGLALSTFVLSLVVTAPLSSGTLEYVVINQGLSILGLYLLYGSVMSLSPLGKVEKLANDYSRS